MDVIPLAPVEIRVEGLRYNYPDGTEALRGVDLLVRKGETLAVLGPNGAGKSTLMLHLNGILEGDGRIEVAGLEVNKKNGREVRSKVGLVFQDPDDQLFSPTVYEDVAFGPRNMRLPAEEVDAAVKRALQWVGLEGFEDRSPHHMSFGEKKRVSLATVLSMEPEILVLDEPVSNLDPRARRHFLEIITVLEGTKLIVTHDLDMARRVASRVVLMDGGLVVADGSPDALLSDAELLERHGLL